MRYNNQSSSLFTARQDFESGGTSSDGHLFKSGLHTTHVVNRWMIWRKEKHFSQFIIHHSSIIIHSSCLRDKDHRKRVNWNPCSLLILRMTIDLRTTCSLSECLRAPQPEALPTLSIFYIFFQRRKIRPLCLSGGWTSAVRVNRQTENCLTLEQLAKLHAG